MCVKRGMEGFCKSLGFRIQGYIWDREGGNCKTSVGYKRQTREATRYEWSSDEAQVKRSTKE